MKPRSALEWSVGAAGPVFASLASDVPKDWRDSARCAEVDPDLHFPEKGGSTREAKRICRGCEVRAECLEYALEHDERFGIWGGLSERERRRLKRQQPGAPKPAPAPIPVVARAEREAAIADHLARGEKACPKCRAAKPLGDFPRSAKSADGHGAWCKPCVLDYQREHRDGLSPRERDLRSVA